MERRTVVDQKPVQILFALLRSAICGTKLDEAERVCCTPELLGDLLKLSVKHDLIHLLVYALMQNDLLPQNHLELENYVLKAVYRYERMKYEFEALCAVLEKAQIPFLPLKGSVIRKYYPEAWMRTSCDIDVLVREEDVDRAMDMLTTERGYTHHAKTAHDVSMHTPSGVNVELHHDLIEDGRINGAAEVLASVWKGATLREGFSYWYEMTEEMFCLYHIVHMAKHLVEGGCGIRPFLDLWILKRNVNLASDKLTELLALSRLTDTYKELSKTVQVWFEDGIHDSVTRAMEEYILRGGVYGSHDNAAAVKAAAGEGRSKSLLKLIFLSPKNLAMIYPRMERYPILYPFYQVKRWFRIFNKTKRDKVKRLTDARGAVTKEQISSTADLLHHLGLDDQKK